MIRDPVAIAWAAGLFEGEGSIYLDRGRQARGNGRLRLRLHLASTDEDVIERFQKIVGVGTVKGPYWQKRSTKPYWDWSISNPRGTSQALSLLLPYLGERRHQQLRQATAEKDVFNESYVPKPKGPHPGARLIEGQMSI